MILKLLLLSSLSSAAPPEALIKYIDRGCARAMRLLNDVEKRRDDFWIGKLREKLGPEGPGFIVIPARHIFPLEFQARAFFVAPDHWSWHRENLSQWPFRELPRFYGGRGYVNPRDVLTFQMVPKPVIWFFEWIEVLLQGAFPKEFPRLEVVEGRKTQMSFGESELHTDGTSWTALLPWLEPGPDMLNETGDIGSLIRSVRVPPGYAVVFNGRERSVRNNFIAPHHLAPDDIFYRLLNSGVYSSRELRTKLKKMQGLVLVGPNK